MDNVIMIGLAAIAVFFAYLGGRVDGRAAAARTSEALKNEAAAGFAALASGSMSLSMPADFNAPVPIGARFIYLGVDMLCTGHQTLTPMGTLHCVRAEYLAGDGAIRMAIFSGTEVDALRAEIGRAVPRAAS